MEIKIDLRKSIPENAKTYYERSKKAKKKIPGLKKAIESTREKLDAVKEKEEIPEEPKIKKKQKKKWYEGYRWFTSSDGFLVLGGKDASTNETLVKKHLEPNDLVFHAEIQGAPFFIVKNPEAKEIPDTTINEASQAAASYSKAWSMGMGSANVYYIKPDQVSKTPPSGEYLPKGAFMIYGKKNWVRDVELKLAIGFIFNEEVEVTGGPITSVSSKTSYYSVFGVGDVKSKRLSEEIKKEVARKTTAEDGRLLKKTGIDDIQRWIPSGKGRLIKG